MTPLRTRTQLDVWPQVCLCSCSRLEVYLICCAIINWICTPAALRSTRYNITISQYPNIPIREQNFFQTPKLMLAINNHFISKRNILRASISKKYDWQFHVCHHEVWKISCWEVLWRGSALCKSTLSLVTPDIRPRAAATQCADTSWHGPNTDN